MKVNGTVKTASQLPSELLPIVATRLADSSMRMLVQETGEIDKKYFATRKQPYTEVLHVLGTVRLDTEANKNIAIFYRQLGAVGPDIAALKTKLLMVPFGHSCRDVVAGCFYICRVKHDDVFQVVAEVKSDIMIYLLHSYGMSTRSKLGIR